MNTVLRDPATGQFMSRKKTSRYKQAHHRLQYERLVKQFYGEHVGWRNNRIVMRVKAGRAET